MNYYPHHIGDFNNATRHLTRVERALYRELIELYYDTEQPLPAGDFSWLCKKVLATSEEERQAVAMILREFFTKDGDVWRHVRCDLEIANYKAKHEAAIKAGKASAESRANKKSTKAKRSSNGRSTDVQPTNNQEPVTKNQEEKKDVVGQKPDIKAQAAELLNFLNSKTGRNYQPVDANLKLIAARLKEGATVDVCRAVIAKKCREWATDPKMEPYLRPKTLFSASNFANYQGEIV